MLIHHILSIQTLTCKTSLGIDSSPNSKRRTLPRRRRLSSRKRSTLHFLLNNSHARSIFKLNLESTFSARRRKSARRRSKRRWKRSKSLQKRRSNEKWYDSFEPPLISFFFHPRNFKEFVAPKEETKREKSSTSVDTRSASEIRDELLNKSKVSFSLF